jgi:predicted RNA binding protein YcfA (HicA-like mRNA interferase family)
LKRVLLLKKLAALGVVFVRHGAGHDLYRQPNTGKQESIPRHSDVAEWLAKSIIRNLT